MFLNRFAYIVQVGYSYTPLTQEQKDLETGATISSVSRMKSLELYGCPHCMQLVDELRDQGARLVTKLHVAYIILSHKITAYASECNYITMLYLGQKI